MAELLNEYGDPVDVGEGEGANMILTLRSEVALLKLLCKRAYFFSNIRSDTEWVADYNKLVE